MTKSIIAVSDSTNPTMVDYVQKQLEAVSALYPNITIEHVNETNDIMRKHARYPNRLPAFFILKNNIKSTVLQAKIDTPELINWVSKNLG